MYAFLQVLYLRFFFSLSPWPIQTAMKIRLIQTVSLLLQILLIGLFVKYCVHRLSIFAPRNLTEGKF